MSAGVALDRTVRLLGGDIFPEMAPAEIVAELSATTVALVADRANLASAAGQSALVVAFICLAELGFEVALDIPDVMIEGNQPPLRGRRLRGALLELGTDLIVPARLCRGTRPPLALLAIGASALPSAAGAEVLRLGGGAFSARIGVGEGGAPPPPFSGTVPFGALLAGAAGAAEVLRLLCARIVARRRLPVAREFDLARPRPIALDLEPLELGPEVDVGELDIVSGGAITNALLFSLLRVAGLHGSARVFDDDRGEESNLNRYPLLRRSLLGELKVEILAAEASDNFMIEPIPHRLDEALIETIGIRERLLVGVNHIPSRWLAQRHCSGWVCVAGTTHFTVIVSEHTPATPCAGCLHPRDEVGGPAELPTISFVSMLAGSLQAYRLLAHATGRKARAPTLAAAFNLAAPDALASIGLASAPSCPVGCEASGTRRLEACAQAF